MKCKNIFILISLLLALPPAWASVPVSFSVPLISRPPALDDFTSGLAQAGEALGMQRIDGFIQRDPHDGAPPSQPTEVLLGYDEANLYAVFLAHDAEPEAIRAHLTRRENVGGDDQVTLMIDTFNDQQRAYTFRTNPLGVQWDAIWSEAQGFDVSFDTVWKSDGAVTPHGYVVIMTIPFSSLRFPRADSQQWGFVFNRTIPRGDVETSYWPRVTNTIDGILNQRATVNGLERIPRGRNIQVVPYTTFRSFKAIDTLDPGGPDFVHDPSDAEIGTDLKAVLRESFVIDATLNPDFSQVESDAPQVTVNQRFEVFFPEKRPFFLENADYFTTPINLLFTRRIADPQAGARFTGKSGPWSVGSLLIDDQSPGKRVLRGDPLEGENALFGVARLRRDLPRQSSLGLTYVGKDLADGFNRVASLDGRLKLSENWITSFQTTASKTRTLGGERFAGRATYLSLTRNGQAFNYFGRYLDIGEDFDPAAGFVPRKDIRDLFSFMSYWWRPESGRLIRWGPEFEVRRILDHEGLRLDDAVEGSLEWEWPGRTQFEVNLGLERERLRPQDFPGLGEDLDFAMTTLSFEFGSQWIDRFNFSSAFGWREEINFAPPAGAEPFLGHELAAVLNATFRPATSLVIDNTYFYTRLEAPSSRVQIFTNQILRTKWNWQLSRFLSFRAILQYDATRVNEDLTSLDERKRFNVDFLGTYRVNPWTALFVGYNSNASNIQIVESPGGREIVRTGSRLLNDANQFFVKFSYLFGL